MTATAAPLLDCGHPPTYKLGHAYAPDAGTRAMVECGPPDVRACRCECGQPYTAHGIGTGTATGADGRTYCYPCAGEAEAASFLAATDYTAYDSNDGRIATWTGRQLARVTSRTIGRGGFGSRVVYLRAVAPDGSRWHGRHSAEWSEAVTLHRCKGGAS